GKIYFFPAESGWFCSPVQRDGTRCFCRADVLMPYYKDHAEEIKEQKKVYNAEHQDEQREWRKNYYQENTEKIAEYQKQYRKNNADKIQEYMDEYRVTNAEVLKEKRKQYNAEHKEDIKKRNAEYSREHITELREYREKYRKQRMQNDPMFKLSVNIRHLISNSLRRQGFSKKTRTYEILGCDYDTFYKYMLETYKNIYGVEWDGKEDVHIDHIIPLATAESEEEIIKLCHYTNLQLLKAKDNLEKRDKIDWVLDFK
ncbi:MAG: hypothetical protein IKU48_02135, partial [Clostridia bacterium]|nr:hypothetical protein [Clostridia bacterium]